MSRPRLRPGSRGAEQPPPATSTGVHWYGPFALALVLAAGAVVHWPALRTFFAQDDVTFLARAMGLSPTPWSLARPLSEGVGWRVAHALFGLHPLPYHALNLGLHLMSAAMVAGIGARLGLGRGAALAAALLFVTTPVAFTPTHWAACLPEIQTTFLALAAFLLWLVARQNGSALLLWTAAAAGLAAVLSKESAVLLPLVLIVANARTAPARSWRVVAPQTALIAVFAFAFAATIRSLHYISSEAYSRDFSPRFLAANLATYLRWCVSPHVPVPDLHAIATPAAVPVGAAVLVAFVALLWKSRRTPPHAEEVGLVWFFAMLAPVLPLAHHSYLYYLYLPWAGLCWALAGGGERVARRWPAARVAFAAFLILHVVVDYRSVRAREREMIGPFPADRTIRESRLLERCLSQLRGMRLPPGTRVVFVNPGSRGRVHFGAAQTTDSAESVQTHLPLEGALRNGEALRVFMPELRSAGFGFSPSPADEDAHLLLFNDQASLMDVGAGSAGLARLGTFCLEVHNWESADSLFRRTRARGDTLPEATYGLVFTSDALGRQAESDQYAREFLRRWPRDSRAAYLDSVLRATPPGR